MNMESKITFLTLKRQFLYLQLLEENDEIIKRKIEDIDNEILLIICDLKRASSVKSKEILAEVVKNTYYYDSNSSKILFYLFDQQLGSVPKEFLMQNQHNNDIFLLPTSYEFDFPDDIPCMTKQHLKYRLLQEHKKTVDEELKKLRRYIDYPLYGKSITNESVKNKQSHEIRKSSLKPNLSTKTITNNNNNININDNETTNKQINRKSEENEQQSKEIINNIPTNEDEIDISSDSGLSYDEIEETPEQLKKKQSKNDKNDNFEDCTDYDLIEFASDLEEYSSDSDNTLSPLEDEEKGNNNNNNIQQTKRLYSNVNMNNTNDNNNNEISNPLKKKLYTPLQENEINQNQLERQISLPLPPAPLISPSNPNEQQQQQQLNKRIRKRKRQFSDEDESGEDSKEEDYLQYEDDLNDEDYNMGSTYNKKSKKKKTPTKKQDKNDNEIIDIKEEEVEVVEEKFSYGTLRQYLISANIPMYSPRDKLNIRYIPIVFATPTISLNVSSST